MLTKKQILSRIENEEFKSQALDGRDFGRLFRFFTYEEAKGTGMMAKAATPEDFKDAKEWTEENVLSQMKEDVAFGFEKALDKRGISSGLMYETVKMWLYILEDDLYDSDDYPQYGLPLFKRVALKYGFDNPIGDDKGTENKYASV